MSESCTHDFGFASVAVNCRLCGKSKAEILSSRNVALTSELNQARERIAELEAAMQEYVNRYEGGKYLLLHHSFHSFKKLLTTEGEEG